MVRLLARGFSLVADDQVDVQDGWASPPVSLSGLLEVRGLGILRMEAVFPVAVCLIVQLGQTSERLPFPTLHPDFGLPVIELDSTLASAPERVILALDCAAGRITQLAGVFTA